MFDWSLAVDPAIKLTFVQKESKELFVGWNLRFSWRASDKHINALFSSNTLHTIFEKFLHFELLVFEISKAIWIIQICVP